MTGKTDGTTNWEYSYNVSNQLTEAKKNGTTIGRYEYDHNGLRLKRIESDTITYYIYNGQSILFEETFNSADTLVKQEYNIELNGLNLAKYTWNSMDGWQLTYHLNDHLGSRQVVCDINGTTINNGEYGTFGIHESGAVEEAAFTGKKIDSGTGFYYYNARWYDSAIGRFITIDPNGLSPYETNNFSYIQTPSPPSLSQVAHFISGTVKSAVGVVSGLTSVASFFGTIVALVTVSGVDEGDTATTLATVCAATATLSVVAIADAGKDFTKAFESSGKSDGGGKKSNINSKISKQMGKRGWTEKSIYDTIDDPYKTSDAINKATGNDATAYFNKDGSYVVVDNVTNDVIQVSDITRPWAPDSTITNPYIP